MVTVSPEDLQYLKDEYANMRHEQYLADVKKDEDLSTFLKGIARGLEIALVKLGVTNTELDRITQEVYKETFPELMK